MLKRCSICGEHKPITSFYPSRGKPASRCKNCTYACVLVWRRAHSDKVSAQNQRYRAKHPDPNSKPRLRKEPRPNAEPRLRKEPRPNAEPRLRKEPRPKAPPRPRMTEAERVARRQAYREAHREELREYHRQYWQEYQRTHHEEILAKKAKYRAKLKQEKH